MLNAGILWQIRRVLAANMALRQWQYYLEGAKGGDTVDDKP